MKIMATLKDIAELAEVSTTTVSRILNKDSNFSVKKDTREKVLQAAAKLDYKVRSYNNIKEKIKNVGIVQWIPSYEEEQDPYYLNLRQSIESYFIENKISVDRYFMENISNIFENDDLDGLICIGKFSSTMAEKLGNHLNKIIFVDSSPNDRLYSAVINDLETGTYDIVNYLKSMGHRHIGFISGREFLENTGRIYLDTREKTYREMIQKDPEIKAEETDIYIEKFNYQTGYQSIMEAYDKKDIPSAFICGSDTIAMGALSALGELSSKLSKKISIISYNNIKSAQYMNPPLTTLSLNTKYMGELAGGLLIQMIDSDNESPVKLVCATELMIRESVYKR